MDVADEARLIHIALAAQDDELAAHAADAAQCRAQLNPQVRSIAAAAAHAKGLLDHNRKDLAEAVALYEGGPRPLACAAALEDLGVATVDGGDTDEAVEVLRPGVGAVRPSGSGLGCRQGARPAQGLGRAPPPGTGAAPRKGLGRHDRL